MTAAPRWSPYDRFLFLRQLFEEPAHAESLALFDAARAAIRFLRGDVDAAEAEHTIRVARSSIQRARRGAPAFRLARAAWVEQRRRARARRACLTRAVLRRERRELGGAADGPPGERKATAAAYALKDALVGAFRDHRGIVCVGARGNSVFVAVEPHVLQARADGLTIEVVRVRRGENGGWVW